MVEAEIRIRYDGESITNKRKAIGVSCRVFAERAGWAYSYQRKLETDQFETISEEKYQTLLQTFNWFLDNAWLPDTDKDNTDEVITSPCV